MSEIKKGSSYGKQESIFNKTVGSPGGFASAFGSPSRPSTQGGFSMSPKKKSTYAVSNLDESNETAKKLKDKLQSFLNLKRDQHQTKDVLYSCLTDMLGTVSLTRDKRLQQIQLAQVDKWFDENCTAVNHRTKVPSYLSDTTVASTTHNTPRAHTAKSVGSSFRFINKIDPKSQTQYGASNGFSQVNKMNNSQSAFMSPQSKQKNNWEEDQSNQSSDKLFMNRRIGNGGGPYIHLDPTKISNFEYGTPSHKRDLDSAIVKSTRHQFSQKKVDLSVTQNVMQWSMFKRTLMAKSAFKKEMFKDSSQFQRLGISDQSSKKPQTAFTTNRAQNDDIQMEDFLRESQDSLQSNESLFDLNKESISRPEPKTAFKSSSKAAKIIDLSNDECLYDFQIKEVDPNAKPKPPQPINPYAISQVEKKTTFTTNEVRDVHQKRLQQIRKYRATHLFYETPAERDAAEQEALNQGTKEAIQRKLNYPAIGEDKKQLNSIIYDQEGGQEIISMSCFSRPPPKTDPKPFSTKASGLSIDAFSKIGYNFKLIPKQNNQRLNELMEIESISRELAKNEIYLPNKTLEKAIIYNNERDVPRTIQGKKILSVDGAPGVIEEVAEAAEFEVKYPKPETLLLENPFAVAKKASKKKKKK